MDSWNQILHLNLENVFVMTLSIGHKQFLQTVGMFLRTHGIFVWTRGKFLVLRRT